VRPTVEGEKITFMKALKRSSGCYFMHTSSRLYRCSDGYDDGVPKQAIAKPDHVSTPDLGLAGTWGPWKLEYLDAQPGPGDPFN
jgi:hypothetical protein